VSLFAVPVVDCVCFSLFVCWLRVFFLFSNRLPLVQKLAADNWPPE